jgi:hypothetical protein
MKKNRISILLKVQFVLILIINCSITLSQPKTNFCDDYSYTVNQGFDNQGCYYKVGFKPTYTCVGGTNNYSLPHGIHVQFSGATISSIQNLSGSWLNTAQRMPSNIVGSSYVYWNIQPVEGDCPPIPTSAIPTGQQISMKIYVNQPNNSNSVSVVLHSLTGNSWPNIWTELSPGYWDCVRTFPFPKPNLSFQIGLDTEVCKGSSMVLNIINSSQLPVGSTVEWYYNTTSNSLPSSNPPSTDWTGPYLGNTFNTNYLTEPNYWFVAVIKTGCYTWYSIPRNIKVCNGPPSATITATPDDQYSALIPIESENHACVKWQGTLNLSLSNLSCNTTITWECRKRCFNVTNGWGNWTLPTPIVSSNPISISTGLLTNGNCCAQQNEFTATLINICLPPTTLKYLIQIDKTPDISFLGTKENIQADIGIGTQHAPIVCKETRLRFKESCGKPDHWEFREETPPLSGNFGPWNIISGSFGTSEWWTNPYPLSKTTQYRVWVVNGACLNYPPSTNPPSNGVYTFPITVKVIPDPTVSINLACQGSPIPALTLTASTNFPSMYPVSYQWYHNGNLISGATTPVCHPLIEGNYYVVFTSAACNKSVKSNVIPVCFPKATITGPCCICISAIAPPETITLMAGLANMAYCEGTCTPVYLWSTGATTQQISVNQPGTYLVTINCGSLCTLTAVTTVIPCPH